PLVEDPRREHEQQDDSERQDRLHKGERREREREQLQRPGGDRERDRTEPERSTRESSEPRDLHRSGEPDAPGLERLERVGDLEAAGCRCGCERAHRDIRRHRCEDALVRGATVAAIGAVGAASAWSAPAAAPFAPALARALDIPRRLATARGVALTFDDGPHAQGTPAVLEVLDRGGATATSFLVGEQVE